MQALIDAQQDRTYQNMIALNLCHKMIILLGFFFQRNDYCYVYRLAINLTYVSRNHNNNNNNNNNNKEYVYTRDPFNLQQFSINQRYYKNFDENSHESRVTWVARKLRAFHLSVWHARTGVTTVPTGECDSDLIHLAQVVTN